MFSKLLKHEFKSQAGLFGILSAVALAAGLVGSGMLSWFIRLAESDTENVIGTILSMMLFMGTVFIIIAYMVAVEILLIYRFYKHHFSDEGYLTFTLPATSHQILLASIVNFAIWTLIAFIVVLLAAVMILVPVFKMTGTESFVFIWEEMMYALDSVYGGGYMVLQILMMIASVAYGIILPLAAVSIGSVAAKKHKLLASFGIYYGLNMVVSMIVNVLSMIAAVGESMITEGAGNMLLTLLIPTLLYIGIAIGGYFLMHRLVDKKLNLP